MATPWDNFIEAMERRKKQLDDLIASYRQFRDKLDALPPEIATEAQSLMAEGDKKKADKTPPVEQDFVGKTALTCARIMLEENDNEALHFSAIARKALQRGYRGRATGNQEEIESRTVNSFWAALHRSDDFEPVGKGCYRLKT